MSDFWERQHQEALELAGEDGVIAPEPAFATTKEVDALFPDADCDMEQVIGYLTSKGIAEQHLGAMAVRLVSPKEYSHLNFGKGAHIAGTYFRHPQITTKNVVYYPWIDIVVPDYAPHLSPYRLRQKLNHNFRHELRHVEQQNQSVPPYAKPWLLRTVRLGATALGTGAAVKLGVDICQGDAGEALLDGAGALSSAVVAAYPAVSIHTLSLREIDANIFAWTHPGLMPITI